MPDINDLSDRQRKALDLLQQGKSTSEIASEMDISENGVYQHKRRLVAAGYLAASASGSSSRTSSGGTSDEIEVRMAREAREGIEAIDREVATLDQQEEDLKARRTQLRERRKRLEQILETIPD